MFFGVFLLLAAAAWHLRKAWLHYRVSGFWNGSALGGLVAGLALILVAPALYLHPDAPVIPAAIALVTTTVLFRYAVDAYAKKGELGGMSFLLLMVAIVLGIVGINAIYRPNDTLGRIIVALLVGIAVLAQLRGMVGWLQGR